MKISVIIPTYNRAHLIRHALDSVLRQTYRNLEIIVVDDGSTDATAAVVSEYGDRVRYFQQANAGVSAARNSALSRATGECVAFLDSDDEWLDFKLALQAQTLERMPEVGFLFTEFLILKDNGRRIHKGSRTWLAADLDWSEVYPRKTSSAMLGPLPAGVPHPFDIYSGRMYRQFLYEAFVLPTTAIVRRDAIGTLRFTERIAIFEDWEFFARISRNHDGAFLDIESAINRGHPGPERLTNCSALTKAQNYVGMLDRVWMADQSITGDFEASVRGMASNAMLAVAREALLESRHDVVRNALDGWQGLRSSNGRTRAITYSMLAAVPGGRALLKGALLGRRIAKTLANRHATYPVNPAA